MRLRRADARFCSTRCRVAAHRRVKLPARMVGADRWLRRTASKRPVTVSGRPGSPTDPSTWSSYVEAVRSSVGAGLGFALGDGVGCYDLDHCVEGGVVEGWAVEFVRSIPEPVLFTELSQSGTGVHVFFEGDEGPGRKIRDGRNIERYTVGRYIAVTGDYLKV